LRTDANHRFLGRPQAPADPSETRRTERWLATARVFLAVSALVAIYMDPTQLGRSSAAYGLFVFYLANSILILMLLRRRKASTASFRLLVHAADIVWPAFISVFAEGPRSPFFLFFFFVLTAAAYRWGLWETLSTAAAEVVLLWAESFVLLHVWAARGVRLPWHVLSGLQINVTEFEPKRLFMLSVYLLVMGLLLGYLAEQQKHLRAEKAGVTRMLSKVRVEAGLTGTLQQIAGKLSAMYGAARLVIASQEIHSQRRFLGELRNPNGEFSDFQMVGFQPAGGRGLPGGFSGRGVLRGERSWTLVCDRAGPRGQPGAFAAYRIAGSIERAPAISLCDRSFLCVWWRVAGTSVRVRSGVAWGHARRVALSAGFAPPGGAGSVQRLSAASVAAPGWGGGAGALRPGTARWSGAVADRGGDAGGRSAASGGEYSGSGGGELGRIQGLLREEVLKLRELMQQMKSIDVDARRFLSVVTDTVERFERETGISARFVTDIEKLEMPEKVCRELLRIVQEGLVNVRKHSKARHALVRLASSPSQWSLTLEDDGKGFPFSGRLTQEELDQMGKGPMIIKERVRLIAGALTVESNPGVGTRLEIKVPKDGEVFDEF
jgi:hypothetical protein